MIEIMDFWEPWTVKEGEDDRGETCSNLMASVEPSDELARGVIVAQVCNWRGSGPYREEIAARIAMCINFCRNLPSDVLKDMPPAELKIEPRA